MGSWGLMAINSCSVMHNSIKKRMSISRGSWNTPIIIVMHLCVSFPSAVIVESVKCLCNIYLMNKHLASSSADLGILQGLAERLSLHCSMTLPHDVLYYDLRLLFLLTACDPDSRWDYMLLNCVFQRLLLIFWMFTLSVAVLMT